MNAEAKAELENLIERYRDQCLWFLRQDFFPHSTEEILHVLDLFERYGDRSVFERAERLKQWLLLPTSAEF